ncbi:aminomethyl-transferring glycine dehydrogenase [bacterium]|nr:aminomethyl-transferring glycine dehydrogenase [bacterium]
MELFLNEFDKFERRHIGPSEKDLKTMLQTIKSNSLDELINETVPEKIRLTKTLNIEKAIPESDFLAKIKRISQKNQVFKSYIGLGYYNTIVPTVILRNVLENPGWYTQYTPYQAEISQGRLEALLNFQTMVMDLTGMQVANASLLDEGTAAAESMIMLFRAKNRDNESHSINKFLVSDKCFPQTIDILKTRAEPMGIEVLVGEISNFKFDETTFGVIVQYPRGNGEVFDYTEFIQTVHDSGVFVVVASDLLSLALLKSPGELGADVVVGNSQRFGVPLGFGGPHAAFFATKDEFMRVLPGRVIGVSIDVNGNRAYRMSLQTREQHIRREKATSNICTAQALLAIMSGMYAVYHGAEGIKNIAKTIHCLTKILDSELTKLGYKQLNRYYFDTVRIETDKIRIIKSLAIAKKINFRYENENLILISLDETAKLQDISNILEIFASAKGSVNYSLNLTEFDFELNIPKNLIRESEFLTHPVFNSHHSETQMLRYLKHLENKDLSLTSSMIPLGSCTMKLNATTEMIPLSWEEFSQIHPFVPLEQAEGYLEIVSELEKDLAAITGFYATSLQPNSGAQGEYAGLMVIRAYQKDRGEGERNVILIPSSAHGTNPASAVMAGMEIIVVVCDEKGNIEVEDLRKKAIENSKKLCGLMVTYPSTHGVFEESIQEICSIIHENGGQVYMDGANMNAQVGLTSPANIGADVCHLNLHKTFAIPHGGGGPGVGPICVAKHLAPYLPSHKIIKTGGEKGISAISAAPWGSASILLISYAYIKMLGSEGVTNATKFAILNANYIKSRLEHHFPLLYKGKNGRVAHEMIFDFRKFKKIGIEVEDVAKRLMDYGFHAPTVSFPVAGTLMIEPTESESKQELDRLCDALISIGKEIEEVENGTADKTDNVLKNAPHTAFSIASDDWKHSYSRQKAAFPVHSLKNNKFWVSVARINNTYGDRNIICSCPPIEDYEK